MKVFFPPGALGTSPWGDSFFKITVFTSSSAKQIAAQKYTDNKIVNFIKMILLYLCDIVFMNGGYVIQQIRHADKEPVSDLPLRNNIAETTA